MARRPKTPKVTVGKVRARADRRRGQRDGRWYWRAVRYDQGREIAVWSGWATTDEATAEIARVVAAGEETAPRVEARIGSVRDLMETWIGTAIKGGDLKQETSYRTYRSYARNLCRILGYESAERLDYASTLRYRNTRLAEGAATRTVHAELIALGAAWRWGRKAGVAPDRDLERAEVVVRATRSKYTPSRSEIAAVVGWLRDRHPWAATCAHLLYATGARIHEVSGLRWRDLDLARRLLRVSTDTKTGERWVPLTPSMVDVLLEWRPETWRPRGRIWAYAANTVEKNLGPRLDEATTALRLRRWTPHALRRAAIELAADKGVDIKEAAAIFGVSEVTMLRYYRETSAAKQRAAVLRAGFGDLEEPRAEAKVVAGPWGTDPRNSPAQIGDSPGSTGDTSSCGRCTSRGTPGDGGGEDE